MSIIEQSQEQRVKTFADAGVIDTAVLKPVEPIKVNSVEPVPVPDVSKLTFETPSGAKVTGAGETLSVPKTDFTAQLEGLMSDVEGRDRQADVLQQTQVQERQLNEINKQIAVQQVGALERTEEALSSGETLGFASLEATKERRTSAIEAMKLSAQKSAIQGELSLARQLAGRAVDEQFKEEERKIVTARNNIIANYDTFTAAEKKRADATLTRLNAEDTFLKEKKANVTAIDDERLMAAEFGGTNKQIADIANSVDQATARQKRISYGLVDPLEALDTREQELKIAVLEKELNRAEDTVSGGISPVTGKAFTESQSKAGTFAVRMEEGSRLIEPGKAFRDVAPIQALKSNERRQFEQAEQNFITAQLRRESGAAISDEEFLKARQVYIPQFGDDEETLAQKAVARNVAIQGMKNESVGSFDALTQTLKEQETADKIIDDKVSGITKSGLKYTIE